MNYLHKCRNLAHYPIAAFPSFAEDVNTSRVAGF